MLTNWNFYNPVRVYSGNSVFQEICTQSLKGSILFLTFPGFSEDGMTEKLMQSLQGAQVTVFDTPLSNPDLNQLDLLNQQFADNEFNHIIAIGGGSILDTAKVLSLILPLKQKNPLHSIFRDKIKQVWESSIPVIAVPTTSGTGAECTPFATVWDQKQGVKYSLENNLLIPKTVILDPTLTLTLPHEQTLFTGLDTLSHALESLWNKSANPVSKMYALEALNYLKHGFNGTLQNPQKVEYRSEMQVASFLAGVAISQTHTAIAHAISYPLTLKYGVPHGLACSFTLRAIIKYVIDANVISKELMPYLIEADSLLADKLIHNYLAQYVQLNDVLNLMDEMYHPDRISNFLLPVSRADMEDLIRNSIVHPQKSS